MTGTLVARLMLLAISAVAVVSCARSPRPRERGAGVDLSGAMARAEGPPGSARDFSMVRAGRRRAGVALVAPAKIAIPVDGVHGSFDFRCFAAPVYNVGDGVTMGILWETATGASILLERRFDAARSAGDRRWTELSVPLEIGGGGRIVLEASAGSSGNLVADWVAVAEPRLVPRTGRK